MNRSILQQLHDKLPKTGSPDFLDGASFMLAALDDTLSDIGMKPMQIPDHVFCLDILRHAVSSGEGLSRQFLKSYEAQVNVNIKKVYPTVIHAYVTVNVRSEVPSLYHEIIVATKILHTDGSKYDYLYTLRVPIYETNIHSRYNPEHNVFSQDVY